MYLRSILFILLALFGSYVIRGIEIASGTKSGNQPWITNTLFDSQHGNTHNQHHQHPTQPGPQYTSEYPSEYTPYYPPQYTPPYPTQGRPQNTSPQTKPPFPIHNKPQPPAPVHHQQQPHPVHHNHPSIKPTPELPTPAIDQFDHRYPDGSYEFRYELPDETTRYERGYFIHYHHKKSLVVRGYYSYRLPGKGYLTVFYTADHYGYRQDSSAITKYRPQLPRTLGERRILADEEGINVPSSINENKLD